MKPLKVAEIAWGLKPSEKRVIDGFGADKKTKLTIIKDAEYASIVMLSAQNATGDKCYTSDVCIGSFDFYEALDRIQRGEFAELNDKYGM